VPASVALDPPTARLINRLLSVSDFA
jgi:hypothetical protein